MFLLILLSCLGIDKSKSYSSEFILMGSLLNKTDQASGVSQASPGANSGGGGFTNFFGGSSSVSEGRTAIRFKVYDDPMPIPVSSGILNFYSEYEFIDSLFDSAVNIPPAEILKLTVDKIEIINSAFPSSPIVIIPTYKERVIEIRRNNHFIPFAMGISVSAGTYSSIKVFLNSKGYAYFNDKEYVLNLTQKIVTFGNSFPIEKEKITSLRSIPFIENDPEFISSHGHYKRNNFDTVQFVDHLYQKNGFIQFNLALNLIPAGQAVHSPLEKLNIMVSQVTAVDKANSGHTLNDKPTIFEFLSLRSGFVGLATHNEVPSTNYDYFEVMLGRNNTIDADGNNSPLIMDERSQSIFRFQGSFNAQSARTMELYLHLDPNKSVFFVPSKGFVFDPVLKLESYLSMTENHKALLIDKLNKRINLVGKDSEVVISGTATAISTILANNVNGKQMIYSDVTIAVNDILRGQLDNSKSFTLRVIGGTYGGIKLEVFGMPKFQVNESFLLFLKKNGNSFIITRGELGKVNL